MIHVVIMSDRARSARLSFETDSPADAIADAVAAWFERSDVDKAKAFTFALHVEDSNVRSSLSRDDIAERIEQIRSVETQRAEDARKAQPPEPKRKQPWEP